MPETPPLPAILLGLDGTVLAANAAALRLTGLLAARTIHQVVPPLGARWLAVIERLRRERELVEVAEIGAGGARRRVRIALWLVWLGRDVVHAVIGDADDAGASVEPPPSDGFAPFAGGIAHDFNNLLVGVLTEASSARDDLQMADTTRDALRRIEAAARRMAQLTRQLLDYASRGRVPATDELEPEPPRTRTRLMPTLARLSGVRVLVADDEPAVRATVRRLLERRGAAVVVVADGAEAEAQLRGEPFGLVVCDVAMPGLDGYQVLAVARALVRSVPVILMSGYTERVRNGSGGHAPDAFLEKPFTAHVLDAAVDDVLSAAIG